MLGHEFEEMPSKSVGETPLLTTMVKRCRWCFKASMAARQDGCPIRELETVGSVSLANYNPDGVAYFADRRCVTCGLPIMTHQLRKDSALYWCFPNQNQFSDGVEGCVYDVAGVTVPEEPKAK